MPVGLRKVGLKLVGVRSVGVWPIGVRLVGIRPIGVWPVKVRPSGLRLVGVKLQGDFFLTGAPLYFLSTRSHQNWFRISLSARDCKGICA